MSLTDLVLDSWSHLQDLRDNVYKILKKTGLTLSQELPNFLMQEHN